MCVREREVGGGGGTEILGGGEGGGGKRETINTKRYMPSGKALGW